ncbi:unnamed protein product [Phaedon cochleariae]|uniref:Chitin-binding type-2 domain-containing protein n=1 Tax=Phaedon cochleariae TaxID=80249 RepID=A0A9P0DI94_PHACE|nr:unnamed protein product [Phaedon cochleariae]
MSVWSHSESSAFGCRSRIEYPSDSPPPPPLGKPGSPPQRTSFHSSPAKTIFVEEWKMHLCGSLWGSSVAFRLADMKGASVLFLLGLCLNWADAQFLNNRPHPTYSLENMPKTDFSCRDKILGGYYADAETNCQMFHICVKVAGIGVQDFRFLCPNGTAFDQDHQICAEWEDIDCDASTLYYSSDNFDLYRIGSGFESKAQRYGEDEETFALQRAETGDARINREQQSNTVNQKKESTYFRTVKQKKPNNNNQNTNHNNDQNNNSEKDIFKSSSSSNFYNNRNNGKEKDEDYDDNVNINQNTDYSERRKVVKNKIRRPVQNNNYNQDNENRNQNNDYNRNQNNNYNKNQNNDNNRNQYNDNTRYQNNEYNKPQNNDNRNQNNDNNRNQYDNTRYQNNENNKPQSNDHNRNENENFQTSQREPSTRRPAPARNTGFQNNFAGSSYVPTTARTTSTTLNADQYTTAIHNYRTRNGQRQRQYTDTDSPVYTISTPAPFRGSQQYNPPPNRQTNSGRYYSTTQAPQRRTENYPQSKSLSVDNYDVPKVKQTGTTAAQTYSTQYDTPKLKPSGTTAAQYDVPRTSSTAAQAPSTQYDTPRVKQTSSPTYDVPRTGSTPAQTYNTQYDTSRTKQTSSTPAQSYNTNYDIQKTKQPSSTGQNFNTQTKFASTTTQYEATKVKSSYPKSTIAAENTDNYPVNNPKYSTFEKKPTTPFKQPDNYPSTLSPKPFSLNTFPSTFAPRTNNAYNQIAHQSINYNKNGESTGISAPTTRAREQSSTVRSTPFTQYTPTVPRISSTTPASRSSRFDETQYDDGSYSTRYDYDTDDRRDDEFLKTAHSQNIAASRNQLAHTTKAQAQRSDAPRPFSATPKATEAPRAITKAAEVPRAVTKAAEHGNGVSTKKAKDVSYDYAYYDSHTDSGEPDYDIATDIKKSTVKN